MNRRFHALVALLGGFVAMLSPSAGAFAQASVDATGGLPLQMLSAPIGLSIAGRPAVLRVVRAGEPPEAVATAVESIWRGRGETVRRDDDGPWRSVSRVHPQGIEALQLRSAAGGGSDGYLIGWRLDAEPSAQTIAHRLLPPSAVTLSDLPSRDTAGRTIVAWMPGPIDEAERTVLRSAAQLGLRTRNEARRGDVGPLRERARFFSGAGADLALTLHREGAGTAVVIHLMETSR